MERNNEDCSHKDSHLQTGFSLMCISYKSADSWLYSSTLTWHIQYLVVFYHSNITVCNICQGHFIKTAETGTFCKEAFSDSWSFSNDIYLHSLYSSKHYDANKMVYFLQEFCENTVNWFFFLIFFRLMFLSPLHEVIYYGR